MFGSPERLAELNRLTHPPMAERMRREIVEVRARASPPPFIVLDAAVLFEAGWDVLCDEVWTVSAAPERALERLVSRNPDREARADRVIRNDGTLGDLAAVVDALAGSMGRAAAGRACGASPPALR